MIMKFKLLSMAAGVVLTACTVAQAADSYRLTLPMNADAEDATVFLVDFDNGAKIDSAVVENEKVVFTGHVDEPVVARIVMEGKRLGNIVLENMELTMKPDGTVDSPLNNVIADMVRRQQEIYNRYQSIAMLPGKDAEKAELERQFNAVADSVLKANINNAVGQYIFTDQAYQLDIDTLKAALEMYPQFKKLKRVNNILDAAEKRARTAVGQKFVDFEIANDSTVQRLSDYVGKGKYVLVDFWASWCGPCIRETAVIKDLYNQYGPQGLEVLGVAVWDEPDNTRAAIEKHQIPWPQIINAQTVPTDLYGITGIPHIIIFGPDGTILSRGKQGDELRADVARIFPAKE